MKFSTFLSYSIMAISILVAIQLKAAWLTNEPVTVSLPDGSSLNCFATGDEFYSRLHDAKNFTIVQSETDGYYYYAQLIDDELVPGSLRVGFGNPRNIGLEPGISIGVDKMKARRSFMEKEMRFAEPESRSTKAGGTLNNLVIYIRFSDQEEFETDTIVNYNRFNATASNASSMYNYFQEVSYGQLFLPSTFYPATPDAFIRSYQDSYPRSYYMPYNAVTNPTGYQGDSQRTSREHTLLANAVTYINLNSPVPANISLDYNNDGNVDNVVFIVRGGPTAWSTLLWPHRWSLYTQNVYIKSKRVYDFNFQLETSLNSSGVGVLCHEMYHSLSAPDLYRYENTNIDPVGPWDIMASNNNPPQYMGAFMKMKYGGWIENIPWITESGTYTLNPLQSSENNAYRIHSQNSASEYFVIEYRKKQGTFDGTLTKSGLLIYRINPAAGNGNAGGPPDEVYLFRPNGTNTNSGSLNEAVFGANYGRTSFDDLTNPNAYLQNGNPGGVYISEISAIGETMSFKVDFPGQVQAQIQPGVYVACAGDAVSFSDASTGLPNSWQWSFSPNTVTFVSGTNAGSKNPVVQFNAEGDYSVSLSVGNSFGTNSDTETNLIHIGSRDGYYADGFESTKLSTGSWKVENPDNNVSWSVLPASGNGGDFAAGINFRTYYNINQRDRLVSMPFDLSTTSSAYLSFDHAYAQNSSFTQVSDSLIVLISADCGVNWQRLAAFGENGSGNFATHQPTTETFWPETATDWCGQGWGAPCNTFDLTPWAGQSKVRIAFETVSFYGNPLLIDNIVVSRFVGSPETKKETTVSIVPNPSSGAFSIQTHGEEAFDRVQVLNAGGRRVFEGKWEALLYLNTENNWSSGVYSIIISNNSQQLVRKMVVNK